MSPEQSIERAAAKGAAIERDNGRARGLARRLDAAYTVLEADDSRNLRAYWQTLFKRRWTVLTVFFLLFTVVLLATLKQKPFFRAQALLEIQRENPDIPSVQELFELETVSDSYLETQYKVLRSNNLARRVIDELRLEQYAEFNPSPAWWMFRSTRAEPPSSFVVGASPRDPDALHLTLKNFRRQLSVEPVKRSRLVSVAFESQDPERAARVVNTLAANYIDQSLQARWDATQKASEWLSQQLLGLKARLEKSEDDLQAYARLNGLLFLVSEKGTPENIVNERLRQLQEELTRAQAARYEKESLFRLVESGDSAALPGVADNKLMQDLTVRLAELRREHAQLLTTFTPEYPRVRQVQNQIDEIEAVLTRERLRAAERITNEFRAASRREALLEQAFAGQQRQANEVAEKSVQYNILRREVETNRQLYEGLLQRLKEAGVSAGLKASNIRIVDAAEPPREPARPRVLLNLSLGLLAGLALGVGLAFLQEHLDNTLKSSEDVERFLRVPALGLIPAANLLNGHRRGVYGLPVRARRNDTLSVENRQWHRIDAVPVTNSVLPEAFRALRTSVLLSSAGSPPRTLLVTSAQVGEGKTTVTANLAISLAQLGQRVLLVDADLRRPSAHKMFGARESVGLVGYVAGQREWPSAVRETGIAGLDALYCGPVPPNPAELLSSDRMRALVREAAQTYNFVLFDSAPLLNLADSRIVSSFVDGVVLVVRGGATPRDSTRRALGQLEDAGANVIGVVLNNLSTHTSGEDYYYYHYRSESLPEDASGAGKESD